MSEQNAKSGEAQTPEDEPTAERAAAEPDAEAAEGETADSELEAAHREIAQLKDQYVRLRAEMENVRKRAERDVESARKYGIERFATELLGVRDSLEAGLAAAEDSGADLDRMREGMELTERMLAQAMEKFGVEPIDPQGEAFNPEYHEAMSTQESAEHDPNTVVNVVQKGYLLNGRVLRPAMVVVSRAPAAGDDA